MEAVDAEGTGGADGGQGDPGQAGVSCGMGDVKGGAGVVLPMAVGAVLMSLSTIIVAFNARLLRRAI